MPVRGDPTGLEETRPGLIAKGQRDGRHQTADTLIVHELLGHAEGKCGAGDESCAKKQENQYRYDKGMPGRDLHKD